LLRVTLNSNQSIKKYIVGININKTSTQNTTISYSNVGQHFQLLKFLNLDDHNIKTATRTTDNEHEYSISLNLHAELLNS